ncbi:hypothetical protein AABB24_007626 [Solanum stoloniferum]|uniref:F-box/LRR-repeat protein 15/At3g58940/PEG3-like LRR domain-containing protein n=2 Tax=Solanum stoloniferum TaxID=62892 RepID=A0ABD2UQS1_9SOLN
MAGPALHDSYSFVGVHLSIYAYIDRWMLYVTRNGVKKLKLNMTKDGTYKLPSYIFNCPTLTHLKLFNCNFKLPNSFLGLQTLTVLQLEKLTFVPAIEFYTINVPLLVKLTIDLCDGTQYLNIVFSSELKSLVVHESHYNLDLSNNFFKKCKKMSDLYLVIDNPIPADNRLTLEKLLFSSPTLETLCLGKFELELLTAGVVPKRLPCTLNCLWHLDLDVNFNKLGQTSYTLELIKSFPNLRELEIWVRNSKYMWSYILYMNGLVHFCISRT